MRAFSAARITVAAVALAMAVTVVVGGGGPASAVKDPSVPARPAVTSYVTAGQLFGVAATSAGNAWAVGHTGDPVQLEQTLIVRWNGKAWSRAMTPGWGAREGITAVSASNAWAVGGAGKGTEMGLGNYTGTFQPLVLHWNGSVGRRRPACPR